MDKLAISNEQLAIRNQSTACDELSRVEHSLRRALRQRAQACDELSRIGRTAQSSRTQPVTSSVESNTEIKNQKSEIRNQNTELKTVAKEMEALFAYQLIKAMRETTNSISSNKKGFGNNTYMSLFDMEISRLFAERGLGIQDALIRWLERTDIQPQTNTDL